jgi:hypothetical protein
MCLGGGSLSPFRLMLDVHLCRELALLRMTSAGDLNQIDHKRREFAARRIQGFLRRRTAPNARRRGRRPSPTRVLPPKGPAIPPLIDDAEEQAVEAFLETYHRSLLSPRSYSQAVPQHEGGHGQGPNQARRLSALRLNDLHKRVTTVARDKDRARARMVHVSPPITITSTPYPTPDPPLPACPPTNTYTPDPTPDLPFFASSSCSGWRLRWPRASERCTRRGTPRAVRSGGTSGCWRRATRPACSSPTAPRSSTHAEVRCGCTPFMIDQTEGDPGHPT